MKSPLASTTPPPISISTLRAMAQKPDAKVSVAMLEAMRVQLEALEQPEAIAELESLFDFETGRPRSRG